MRDRKTNETANIIFSQIPCSHIFLAVLRVALRVSFQKLITIVQKESIKPTNFSLSYTLLPNLLRCSIDHLIKKCATIDSENIEIIITLWCDIFNFIFYLRAVCDNQFVIFTPNIQTFILSDLLANFDEQFFLKVYDICNQKLNCSGGSLLSFSLASEFIEKYVLLNKMLSIAPAVDLIQETLIAIKSLSCDETGSINTSCPMLALHLNKKNHFILESHCIHLKVCLCHIECLYCSYAIFHTAGIAYIYFGQYQQSRRLFSEQLDNFK